MNVPKGPPKSAVLAGATVKRLFIEEKYPTVRLAVEAWIGGVDATKVAQYAVQLLQKTEAGPSSDSPWEIFAESREELLQKIAIEGLMALLRSDPELTKIDSKYME